MTNEPKDLRIDYPDYLVAAGDAGRCPLAPIGLGEITRFSGRTRPGRTDTSDQGAQPCQGITRWSGPRSSRGGTGTIPSRITHGPTEAQEPILTEEARRSGTKIFFADEAHFRTDAELRGKWMPKGEPARGDSTSPRRGEKASYYSTVCLESGLPGERFAWIPGRWSGWN